MRTLLATIVTLTIFASGCGKTRSCNPGTLAVSLTLQGSTTNADGFDVTATVGQTTFHATTGRASGAATGTLELHFSPGTYPVGKSLMLTVLATTGTQVIGSGTVDLQSLPPSCAALDVTITSNVPDLDVPDLASDDAESNADLFNTDLPENGDAADGSMLPVATARLIAPASGSVVTQQQPTFRWVLGAGGGTAVVDLCKDRDCTTPVPGVMAVVAADKLSAKPSSPLPTGWVFWRVRVSSGALTNTSATWQAWVPKKSASTTIDSTTGTIFDVNGDGRADFLVGADLATNGGAAHVYVGSVGGFQRIDITNPDGANASFGFAVANAGDVNGDGYTDFLVGATNVNSSGGVAHLYLGGPGVTAADWNGASAPKRIDLSNVDGANAQFGWSVSGAGDVNGDGFADFAVGALNASASSGSAHLYLGKANPVAQDWNGSSAAARIDLANPDGANASFGIVVTSAGDVNGDGFGDFVIGAYGANSSGAAHLYLGESILNPAHWNGGTPTKRLDLTPIGSIAQYGQSARGAGDVNGDGYSDFLIGAPSGFGLAQLYLGGPTPNTATWNGSTAAQRVDLNDPDGTNANFGISVATAGDVNGDGYDDFVVGARNANTNLGAAHLYLGAATPVASNWNGATPSARIDLTSPGDGSAAFGQSSAGAGDVNGDGYCDFVIGAPSGNGGAYFYNGEATPAAMDWNGSTPAKRTNISSPDGTTAFFGRSVGGTL